MSLLKVVQSKISPGDPPENEQNPYIQGGLLTPLGNPKFFEFFFHMLII